MPRPTISLEKRQEKLDMLIEHTKYALEVYEDKPTPSNKVKLLNLQNRIRHERARVNKVK
jgi:hypothetical protein